MTMATQDFERAETGNLTTAVAEVEVGATPHSRRAFSVTEFCLGYGIGRTIAYQEIAAGRLRAVKVGPPHPHYASMLRKGGLRRFRI